MSSYKDEDYFLGGVIRGYYFFPVMFSSVSRGKRVSAGRIPFTRRRFPRLPLKINVNCFDLDLCPYHFLF